MRIDTKIELKEHKAGKAVVLLAKIHYVRGGKTWVSTVKGQGATRSEAAADLAGKRLSVALKSMLLAKLKEADAVDASKTKAPVPKADKSLTPPQSDGEDKNGAAKSQPSSKPLISTLEGEQPKKESKVSEKPAGTQPDRKSPPQTEKSPKDEF